MVKFRITRKKLVVIVSCLMFAILFSNCIGYVTLPWKTVNYYTLDGFSTNSNTDFTSILIPIAVVIVLILVIDVIVLKVINSKQAALPEKTIPNARLIHRERWDMGLAGEGIDYVFENLDTGERVQITVTQDQTNLRAFTEGDIGMVVYKDGIGTKLRSKMISFTLKS